MTIIFRLVPALESLAEDLENSTDKTSTLCSSLATVMLKTFNTKDPKALSIIEKIPTFLLKEKKRDKIIIKIKDKLKIRGHHFEKKYFDQVVSNIRSLKKLLRVALLTCFR